MQARLSLRKMFLAVTVLAGFVRIAPVRAVSSLELPIVVSAEPSPDALLETVVDAGVASPGDVAGPGGTFPRLLVSLGNRSRRGLPPVPPKGARLCRIPPGTDVSEALRLAEEMKAKWPGVVPVVSMPGPFAVVAPPSGILFEVPVDGKDTGWFLYRYYLSRTRRARFLVPELSESQVLLGAAAGRLAKRLQNREGMKTLARLYTLVWAEGGLGEHRDSAPLLLLPDVGTMRREREMSFLEGFFRAVLEAGFVPRVVVSGDVGPSDMVRYRAVLVPDASFLRPEEVEALREVADRGGLVVLGKGLEGKEVLSLAGMGRREVPSPPSFRFREVRPSIPVVGTDGLARADRRLCAGECVVFLGGRNAPMIARKGEGAGWVYVLNLDFTGFPGLSAVGAAGAGQVREVFRLALGRARIDRWGGAAGMDGRKTFEGLRGPVPAGVAHGPWYTLVFFWTGGAKVSFGGGKERLVERKVFEGGDVVVEGLFERRMEWFKVSVEREDNALFVKPEFGGIGRRRAVPLLLEALAPGVGGGQGRRLVAFLAGGEPIRLTPAPPGERFLVEDLLYSFRALAIAPEKGNAPPSRSSRFMRHKPNEE